MAVRSCLIIVAVAALAQVSCTTRPSATPGDVIAIRDEFGRRGITIVSSVSGASACPGQPLHDNALHLRLTTTADAEPRDLYLYLFRSREFDQAAAEMDACAGEYATQAGALRVHRVDVAPYRALGAGWSDALERTVREALRAAAGVD